MSLYPFFDRSYNYYRPSRISNQHFGLGLSPEDFLEPLTVLSLQGPGEYLRPWRSESSKGDTGSTVCLDKNKFQANLDVQQFKPEEITVKLSGDNIVTIEGKHEEKEDEHGFIFRHFVRKYVLPKNCDTNQLQSKLSSDGILTITAPTVDAKKGEHKTIPIQQTGEPAKRITQKKNENEQ